MSFADPDALIESLLYDLAVKDEEIVALIAERDSFRTLARVAISECAALTRKLENLQAHNRELLSERGDRRLLRHEAAA